MYAYKNGKKKCNLKISPFFDGFKCGIKQS